jgi:hypothetical protein
MDMFVQGDTEQKMVDVDALEQMCISCYSTLRQPLTQIRRHGVSQLLRVDVAPQILPSP